MRQGQARRIDARFHRLTDHQSCTDQPCEQQQWWKLVTEAAAATASEASASTDADIIEAAEQIERDLDRTWPGHERLDRDALRRVRTGLRGVRAL